VPRPWTLLPPRTRPIQTVSVLDSTLRRSSSGFPTAMPFSFYSVLIPAIFGAPAMHRRATTSYALRVSCEVIIFTPRTNGAPRMPPDSYQTSISTSTKCFSTSEIMQQVSILSGLARTPHGVQCDGCGGFFILIALGTRKARKSVLRASRAYCEAGSRIFAA
jgi:hypothetical protein